MKFNIEDSVFIGAEYFRFKNDDLNNFLKGKKFSISIDRYQNVSLVDSTTMTIKLDSTQFTEISEENPLVWVRHLSNRTLYDCEILFDNMDDELQFKLIY